MSKISIQTVFNNVLELSLSFSYIAKTTTSQCLIHINNSIKTTVYFNIWFLNVTWINRNIICNEQSSLDSSFQLQTFQNCQTGNFMTRSIQQIISSLANSFTCIVRHFLLTKNVSFQTHHYLSLINNKQVIQSSYVKM